MTGASRSRAERTLEVAEEVQRVLAELGAECALIGALALAVYKYARSTEDLDLATAVNPFAVLRRLVDKLRERGYEAELNEPDAQDPLGGVVNVRGPDFQLIQVVNFLNPLGGAVNPGPEAVREARPSLVPGSGLRVVTLPHLVALKLYAGGAKSKLDVVELLARNRPLDLDAVRGVCRRFGLEAALDRLLAEAGLGP